MSLDQIQITGARENNLKNISLTVPKRKITVFTGVSGSGKSSIVFDTIAAEAQRQLNETFTAFARARLPKYGQPDVDTIEGISAAIIVDQKRLGGGARSTVGTVTDIYSILRLLFSRAGEPYVGYSNAFSFNDPQGMCPECEGLGRVTKVDLEKLVDKSKSLNEGAILHPQFSPNTWFWKQYAMTGWFDLDKKLADYSQEEWQNLLHGETKVAVDFAGSTFNSKYEGLVDKFTRLYIRKDAAEMADSTREVVDRFVVSQSCQACLGTRLNEKVLNCRIDGYNIAELAAMEATDLITVLDGLSGPKPVIESLVDRLHNLVTIGLGYISLNRETSTLSGGESQRIKMVRHLSSSLIDMMYVFDEPSVGLHARDVERLNRLLIKLRDKGNTVLVVEHDRDVIEVADHVIDVGPKAGAHGGEIVFSGTVAELTRAETLTGRYLKHQLPLKASVRVPKGKMTIAEATEHNLKKVTVDIPIGVLTVITGVAGSGKSTLINDVFVSQHPEAIVIDQSALSTNIRSNPATYTGMMDDVRKMFAKANGVSPGLFSFNSKGACEACQGLGVIYTDLAFMDGFRTVCEVCQGRRFKEEVLQYKVNGKSISDVLEMTAGEAPEFLGRKKILQAVNDVGLDYLKLGQPLSTLSGGECQRIKLATELHKGGTIYVMDEPTTGLHMSDIKHLLEIFDRLVDRGNSVIIIEHNLDVIKNADWLIDLGPEGGSGGGTVVFEGTPSQMLEANTHTAQYLRARG